MQSRQRRPAVMQTYIVRIYRRSGDEVRGERLAGTVERMPGGNRRAFDSFQQLADILALSRRAAKPAGPAGA